MIDKEHIKGFFIGAAVAAVLITATTAFADPVPTSLRPNGGISTDSKGQYGATRLFRVEGCEVWGFNWRNQDRVVAVCPQASPPPTPIDVKPVVNLPASPR
jgi:hypothetical protein